MLNVTLQLLTFSLFRRMVESSPYAKHPDDDLFPLPNVVVPGVTRTSRGVAQRTSRSCAQLARTNETINALNWMAGYEGHVLPSSWKRPIHAEVLERISDLVSKRVPNENTPSELAAAKSILKGKLGYTGDASINLKSYCVSPFVFTR